MSIPGPSGLYATPKIGRDHCRKWLFNAIPDFVGRVPLLWEATTVMGSDDECNPILSSRFFKMMRKIAYFVSGANEFGRIRMVGLAKNGTFVDHTARHSQAVPSRSPADWA